MNLVGSEPSDLKASLPPVIAADSNLNGILGPETVRDASCATYSQLLRGARVSDISKEARNPAGGRTSTDVGEIVEN